MAENDLRLDTGLIIFAFAVILQLFGTFRGISFCPLGLTPYEPLVVKKLTIPYMKASMLSLYDPEKQWHGIDKVALHTFLVKSMFSRKKWSNRGPAVCIS